PVACSCLSLRLSPPSRAPPFPSTTPFRSRATRPPCGPSPPRRRASRPRPCRRRRAWRPPRPPRDPRGRAPSLAGTAAPRPRRTRSEEHTSELQSQSNLVCRLLLEKKKRKGVGRFLSRLMTAGLVPVVHVQLAELSSLHEQVRLRRGAVSVPQRRPAARAGVGDGVARAHLCAPGAESDAVVAGTGPASDECAPRDLR